MGLYTVYPGFHSPVVSHPGTSSKVAVGGRSAGDFFFAVIAPKAAIVQDSTGAAKARDGRERPPTGKVCGIRTGNNSPKQLELES